MLPYSGRIHRLRMNPLGSAILRYAFTSPKNTIYYLTEYLLKKKYSVTPVLATPIHLKNAIRFLIGRRKSSKSTKVNLVSARPVFFTMNSESDLNLSHSVMKISTRELLLASSKSSFVRYLHHAICDDVVLLKSKSVVVDSTHFLPFVHIIIEIVNISILGNLD